MNNTVITITNLPADIAAFFSGTTSVVLDIPTEFSIRLSKNVEQLSILNKISTEAALGFSVPFSPVNDRIFGAYATPLTLNNTTVFFNCQVLVDGHPIQFTRLFVRGKSERNSEWELELARNPDHWVELASQVKTNELSFGNSPFFFGRSQIVATWANPSYEGDYKDLSGGDPVAWPPVDYGGWCDQTEVPQGAQGRYKSMAVEDFRPWLSWKYILQAGFCKIGWTIESILFDLDVVKRLWVYALRPDYFIASKRGGRVTGQIYNRTEWTANGLTSDLLLEDVTALADYIVIDNYDFPVLRRYCAVKNFPGVALKYRFFFTGEFHNDRALPFTAYFTIDELTDTGSAMFFTGESLSTEPLQIDFAPHEKKSVTFDMTVTLKPGQIGAVNIQVVPTSGFFIEKGFFFKVIPANDSLMTEDLVTVSECVSDDMSILDWTKAFVQLVNGRLTTDWETKTVTIFPNKTSNVFGQTAPGFLLREDPVEDIDHIVVEDSILLKPIRPDLKRFTRFGFKKSTDSYIDSLNLSEPAHSRKLLNSVDLPNSVEEILNPFIEPTLEGQIGLIGSGAGNRNPLPFLPRLWDNTDGNRSFNIGPRVLYAYGSVRQINPNPVGNASLLTSFFLDHLPNVANTGLVTNFGYFTQSPTWKISPTPSVVADIVFGLKSQDLFTIFYLGYTQDNRSGTIADLLLKISIRDYLKYDFRKLYRFNMRGVPIIAPMVSVRDFSSGSNDSTPIQFFVEPAELECCDLPCGCQFVTCDYYQDFGIYLRQSTLDDLRIWSFEVDGVELLTSPIGFGTINIIDIGGKPYVTNLVDTLNSIGAPYFSFSYSSRVHPEKGLRFFTLKRLACVQFKILIKENLTDAYEYTHESQLQAVFQAGFDDMGYGSAFYNTPIDCITATEY